VKRSLGNSQTFKNEPSLIVFLASVARDWHRCFGNNHRMDGRQQVDRNGSRRATARILEIALAIMAVVCLCTFAGAQAYRWVSSRNALREFDRARLEPAADRHVQSADRTGDITVWSEKRIRMYHESLSKSFPGPIAVLAIPKLDIRVPIIAGTDEFALNRGVGWINGTARPGQSGNIGIAGHRDGFFRPLKDIREGDEIELATFTQVSRYKVDQIEIVTPDDVRVLRPRQTDSLTLVTCYPFYFVGDAPRRYIVHATRQTGQDR